MLQGDTRNLPLQNICQTLALNQQEGVLTVHYQKLERVLAIRKTGISLLNERPYKSQILQEIVVRLKVLTTGEYQNVFSTISTPSPPGDFLLDRHVIQREQVNESIREQLLERIYEVFEWCGARYMFEMKAIPHDRLVFSGHQLTASLEFPVKRIAHGSLPETGTSPRNS